MSCQNFIRVSVCLFIGAAVLCAVQPPAVAQEAPKEIPHESGLYYTIQKGDTLWDLSKRFFDSPDQWPDLWKKNHQIPNPHWIYPGERIRIFRQEGIEQVKEPEKTLATVKAEEPKKLEPPKVQAPPQEPPHYYYAPIDHVGFIRKEPVTSFGTIFRTQDDKAMISHGDVVYIRSDKLLYSGATYTVYRPLKSIRGKKYSEVADVHGTQYYFTGVIEIIKSDADYYVAKVIRSYRDIRIEDQIMPYQPRSPKIILAESTEGIQGQIITNEDRDRMFGDHAIAFIDKGKKDGIQVGQTYSVFYKDEHGFTFDKDREEKFSASKETLQTPIDYAKILVLLTEESTATVLVTYSEKDLYPTAMIRTPIK